MGLIEAQMQPSIFTWFKTLEELIQTLTINGQPIRAFARKGRMEGDWNDRLERANGRTEWKKRLRCTLP